MAIEAAHYEQTRAALRDDPIIRDMYANPRTGIKGIPLDKVAHEDGTPKFEFMMGSLREWQSRGGVVEGRLHIGAVAEVLVEMIKADQ